MVKKIYVGNLVPKATEDEIKSLFEPFGEVHSVKIIMDWDTGSSRGFGFVEMDAENANKAIAELDGSEFLGLDLKINEARNRRAGTKKPGSRPGGQKRRTW